MKNNIRLKWTTLGLAVLIFTLWGLSLWRNAIKQEADVEIGFRSVILYGKAARPMFKQCSRHSPTQVNSFWEPEPQHIRTLEFALPQFLSTQKLHDKQTLRPRLEEFLNYYKQYAGFSRGKGRFIYLNAVGYVSTTWLEEASVPCDGGDIAFGVEYDVESGQFSEFHFNGAI